MRLAYAIDIQKWVVGLKAEEVTYPYMPSFFFWDVDNSHSLAFSEII